MLSLEVVPTQSSYFIFPVTIRTNKSSTTTSHLFTRTSTRMQCILKVIPKTSWTRDIPTSRLVSALQVTILPPTNLYHPVLPVRTNDKLTVPLCEARVEEEMAKTMLDRTCVCHHTNKQRQILGTWCPLDLEKAVEKGYVIVTIHEVWHFPETI